MPGKSKALYKESDFVIVNKNTKTVHNIECKAIMTGIVGKKAIEQTQKLKAILQELFASELASKNWYFVGMIYTNTINTKESPCAECMQFIINGPTEVATKLTGIEALRAQLVIPCHAEYVSLVQSLTFVVLAHPLSTHCTNASDVYNKVVGKEAKGKSKGEAGQLARETSRV